MSSIKTNSVQNIFRIVLGLLMIFPGIGHLTFQRAEFLTQVPDWVLLDKDFIVVVSGVIEIVLGLAMIFWTKQKVRIGIILGIFLILVFPGNVKQFMDGTDAFGLDTDQKRLIRLFFQPILVLWAVWSTGALNTIVLILKSKQDS